MTDIYKINESLSTTRKVSLLNDMVVALEGLVEQGSLIKMN